MSWFPEHIRGLAPDEASLKAAQKLADFSHWQVVGSDEGVVWGVYAGSAREPYRALAIRREREEVVFHCTCPSRKRPCKHVLGLLWLKELAGEGFPAAVAPDWVSDWLATREARAQKAARKAESAGSGSSRGSRLAAKGKRASAREARVQAGLELVERWLGDLVSQGFSRLAGRGGSEWEEIALRLVDAQAPGLARMVRRMADVPGSSAGWPTVLLDQMAHLFLAVESYRRIDRLPPESQADLRAFIGFTMRREEVMKGPAVTDRWLVLGEGLDAENRLKERRTWLAGLESGRTAAIVEYSVDEPAADPALAPGAILKADLYFYPSAWSQRAVMGEEGGREAMAGAEIPGSASVEQPLDEFARALAANPWLWLFPMSLKDVTPAREDHGQWAIVDRMGRSLPLAAPENAAWSLLALSGGNPLDLFGEWDGEWFRPLTAIADRRWVRL